MYLMQMLSVLRIHDPVDQYSLPAQGDYMFGDKTRGLRNHENTWFTLTV